MVDIVFFGVRVFVFNGEWLVVWFWVSKFIFVVFSIFIYKMGIIMIFVCRVVVSFKGIKVYNVFGIAFDI